MLNVCNKTVNNNSKRETEAREQYCKVKFGALGYLFFN